jgi:hypothetical protein
LRFDSVLVQGPDKDLFLPEEAKKDNCNSIKIGCTMLDGAFVRNGYNQQKIVASQFGELFL